MFVCSPKTVVNADIGPRDTQNAQTAPAHTFTSARSATVLVASTGGANGTRPDTTGPTIATWLRERDFEVRGPLVYADADIAAGIADAKEGSRHSSSAPAAPGLPPRMPPRKLPGQSWTVSCPASQKRSGTKGLEKTPHASLSRGVAGLTSTTVIVNLPGSPGGVKDGLAVLGPIIDHLLAQVAGGGAHDE